MNESNPPVKNGQPRFGKWTIVCGLVLSCILVLLALALVSDKLTDNCLIHLEKLAKLKFLNLESTAITEDGINKQEAALPMCDTHSRICSRVEIFLTSCQYKATIDSSAQFLIEFGMRSSGHLQPLDFD